MTDLPLVAFVGEPNAGKSTLLNKIAGRELAVTSPEAGTTRDRQYTDTAWNGRQFAMVDTAGLSYEENPAGVQDGESNSVLEAALLEQIDIAVAEADVLVFVVDGKTLPEIIDRKVLLKFRKVKKPLLLAVNKLDSTKILDQVMAEYQMLGIKNQFGISALTGRGTGDLLDAIVEALPPVKETEDIKKDSIAVSIVGKPNVGKSSILNYILGEKRVVVSPVPGTTRAAIDTEATIAGTDYTFIDTAGLRRRDRGKGLADRYSSFQTFKAIRRSDVCLFVIDSLETVSKQDQHIAGDIIDMEKGCIILVNKMDAFDGDEQQLRDRVSYHFPFLWYSPVFLVSANEGTNIDEAIAAIKPIHDNRNTTIEQEELDKLLAKTLKVNPPKLMRDQRQPKVFGLVQTDTIPPTFELYVNFPAAISEQYRRHLQKEIAKAFNFWGTPIILKLRGKDKK